MKSDKQISEVLIQEFYDEEDGKVFRYWKFLGEVEYRKELTPYTKLPWVKITNPPLIK